MRVASPFFDTNVLFYLLSSDAEKADKAEELLAGRGIISVQVLNEFASIAARKAKMNWPEIRNVLNAIRATCQVVPITIDLHEDGVRIAEQYGYTIYDSLIVAAALSSGCETLYSEDLQDNQAIDALTIRNPFRAN